MIHYDVILYIFTVTNRTVMSNYLISLLPILSIDLKEVSIESSFQRTMQYLFTLQKIKKKFCR